MVAFARDGFVDARVRVSLSESGRFDGPEPAALWGLGADGRFANESGRPALPPGVAAEVLVRPCEEYVRVADLLSRGFFRI